jgi:large repetitive protein
VNDYVRAASKTANASILNVLANDTFNGTRATTSNVRITQISPAIQGVALDLSTGAISTTTRASSGTYNLVYQICEITAPTNCDTATATIELSGRTR